jgi:hypothetical protein
VPLLASHPFAKGSPDQKPARGAEICAGSGRFDAHVGVAQLVEHRFCKPKVRGSSPLASSKRALQAAARTHLVGRRCSRTICTFRASFLAVGCSLRPKNALSVRAERVSFSEGCPSGQREQAVNLPASAYVGSNPSPSTNLRPFARLVRARAKVAVSRSHGAAVHRSTSELGAHAADTLFFAGVAQLVERQPSKLNVVGSSPISRSSCFVGVVEN